MSGTHNMLDRGYDRPIVNVRCSCGEQKAIDVHDKNFESLMTWCHQCQAYTEQWQSGPALGHFEPSNLDPLTTEFWADYRERFGRRP